MNPTAAGLQITEDDGKSAARQERELCTMADQLAVNVVSVYSEDEDETVA